MDYFFGVKSMYKIFSSPLKFPAIKRAVLIFLIGSIFGSILDDTISLISKTPHVSQFYLDKIERLDRFRPKGKFSFFGDSHVEWGPWGERLPFKVANFGVAGDGIDGVSHRIGTATSNRVILLIGVNDIIVGKTPNHIAERIGRLIKNHIGQVFLLEVMPVRGRYGKHNDAIRRLNRLLGDACTKRCSLVPTWEKLAVGNQLAQNFTNDGLHLNASGYEVLARVLLQHLRS